MPGRHDFQRGWGNLRGGGELSLLGRLEGQARLLRFLGAGGASRDACHVFQVCGQVRQYVQHKLVQRKLAVDFFRRSQNDGTFGIIVASYVTPQPPSPGRRRKQLIFHRPQRRRLRPSFIGRVDGSPARFQVPIFVHPAQSLLEKIWSKKQQNSKNDFSRKYQNSKNDFSMNDFNKKYQNTNDFSKNDFSRKHQNSKNDFSRKYQNSKNDFHFSRKYKTVRTISVGISKR